MKVSATNEATGEVIELPASTLQEVRDSWLVAMQYEKAAKKIKDQLKKIVREKVPDSGVSEEYDGYKFRVSAVQRMTYDISVMRNVLDEDLYHTLVKPDKTAVDTYLKENIASTGDVASELRSSMIADGKPYEVIKLEKLT